jgi:hypothetical protein
MKRKIFSASLTKNTNDAMSAKITQKINPETITPAFGLLNLGKEDMSHA